MTRARALGAFSLCLLFACSGHDTASMTPLPPAVSVETATVGHRAMPRSLPITGTLLANQKSDVAANASGLVTRTLVERGSLVREGAPLIQLDTRAAALGQTEARANLRNAQTQVDLANTTCTRNESLYKQGAITRVEWERASSQCQVSLGTAEAARARAELAAKSLSDTTVRAPFSGVIDERQVSPGEYVHPYTKVATLVALDPLRLQFTLGERDIGLVHAGQDVVFEVESFPGERFTGTVKYLGPTVRSATRDLVVEATVSNADHRLRPGMFATARLQLPDEPIVSVPARAVRREPAGARLFIVVSGLIEEHIVQLGVEKDGYVAVLDGIKPGERVVLSPGESVKDGTPVK